MPCKTGVGNFFANVIILFLNICRHLPQQSPRVNVPTVALFLWLNEWSCHIWCAILLNDIIDIIGSTHVEPWYISTRKNLMCVLFRMKISYTIPFSKQPPTSPYFTNPSIFKEKFWTPTRPPFFRKFWKLKPTTYKGGWGSDYVIRQDYLFALCFLKTYF